MAVDRVETDHTVRGDWALRIPSPLQELDDERLSRRDVRVFLKRDDLINSELPGNKWRKLKYNLEAAAAGGHRTLLTFGGAYSNHIRAVAAAGQHFGYSTIGVIRGEEHLPLNPTLAFAVERGMTLDYLDRTSYRDKSSPNLIASLRDRFGDFFLIPEGGSNADAVRGVAELPVELDLDYDVICCSCGTGGTLAGIAAGVPPTVRALGFSSLKGGGFLVDDVRRLQRDFGLETDNWSIELDYHFGGFARRNADLDQFIVDFRARHGVELEWVYVAKMIYGLFDLVASGRFEPGTSVVAVVTGPATP